MEHYYIGVDVGGTKIAFGPAPPRFRHFPAAPLPRSGSLSNPASENPVCWANWRSLKSAGDALALWAVDHMAHYMALWLFDLYQILNINCFVFGGGLVHFGPLLFDKAFEEFQRYNKNDLPVYFRFAQLGGDAGIIGASRLFS